MSVGAPCPVATCISPVKSGQLLCLDHWRATPPKLQTEVNRTWRAYGRRAGKDDPAATLALLNAYRAARDAAIGHHDNREAARG